MKLCSSLGYFEWLSKIFLALTSALNLVGFFFFKETPYILIAELLLLVGLFFMIGCLVKAKNQLEERLIQEASLAEIGKMMGMITHEINNPIGIIKSQALRGIMILEQGNNDIETHHKLYQSIKNSTERTQGIVQNIKSAISKPLDLLDVGVFPLKKITDRAINFLQIKLNKTTINIECQFSANDLIYGNFSQLEHVFLNLISNSIDAIKDQENPWIKIEYKADQNFYYVKITDSGNGIPEEYLAKINQGFFTSKGAEGSGQGLLLCKKILKNHHGELNYIKEANTTFEIKLPKQVATK